MHTDIKVTFQQSEGVAALGIPKERLEAIAQEIAQIGIDPHWSKQRSYSITLAYEWGPTPLSLLVRKKGPNFEVTFVLKSEVELLGYRQVEEEYP